MSALSLAEHPDLVPTLIALWRLDSPPVLLDPRWGSRLTRSVIAHSRPAFSVELGPSPALVTVAGLHDEAPGDLPPGAAFIGYTSGSTGDPKAIAFTHEKLHDGTLGNAAASVRLRGAPPRRLALSMRMSGSGVINLHYTWAVVLGACVVVLPELTAASARDYWRRIEDNDIDQTFLVPQLVELINRFAAGRDTSRRGPLCFTGSAPLPPRTQGKFQERFKLPLINAYGLSETSSAAFFGHLGGDGLATNSVGTPERVSARLRDTAGAIVDGAGEGEIELRGRQVLAGYWRNPAATSHALVDGWLRTGDVGRRDRAGCYYIVGRSKDVVMKGSFAIYLSEVEEAALAHPAVAEAAAVPVLLSNAAEDIGCLIRTTDSGDVTAESILAWLREALGVQRAPCRVVLTSKPLPRGGQDKLDRPGISSLWDSLPSVPPSLGKWMTGNGGTS